MKVSSSRNCANFSHFVFYVSYFYILFFDEQLYSTITTYYDSRIAWLFTEKRKSE